MSKTVYKNLNKEKTQFILSKLASIGNKNPQNRAFISELAIDVFSEYLKENKIKHSTEDCLHQVIPIVEKIDIADIRTEDNVIIDIRAVINDEYPQLCVPKEHFSGKIQPDIYVGIRIDKDLEKAEIIGYIKAEDISRTEGSKNYYAVDSDELNPIKELKKAIKTINAEPRKYIAWDHQKTEEFFFPFIDGEITEENKNYLLEHLHNCSNCRKEFIALCRYDNDLKTIKNKLLIDDDYTLRLFSGDPVLRGEETEVKIVDDKKDKKEEDKENKEEEVKTEESKEDKLSDEPVTEETSKEEEVKEEAKPKKKQYRDWADELISSDQNDQKDEEDKTDSLSEENILDENILDENILNENILNEDFLNEDHIDSKEEHQPALPEKHSSSSEHFLKKPEETDDEVVNILETLNDVEIINEENDINDLLSFFDHNINNQSEEKSTDQDNYLEKPEQKEVIKEDATESSEDFIVKNKKEKTVEKTFDGYSTVLNKKGESDQNNEEGIIIYEESQKTSEEISPTDFLNIFDNETPNDQVSEYREKRSLNLKTLFKDKNIVAFTLAITLSTTVLFLYLGQINKQVKISRVNPTETTVTKEKEKEIQVKQIKREREPLKSYTKEVIKTVRHEENKKPAQPDWNKLIADDSDLKEQEKEKKEPKEIKIKNISWELGASIARDPQIKKYFLDIGYQLKSDLSKELYTPGADINNTNISIYAEMNAKGKILQSEISDKSESQRVNNICLKVLNKNLKEMGSPKNLSKEETIKFKLLITI